MSYKIFSIAKELKLHTDTILDFVKNTLNLDTSKKIYTRLDENQYLEVLKKFDIEAYNKKIGKEDSPSKPYLEKNIVEKRTIDLNDEVNAILSVTDESIQANRKNKNNRSVRKIRKDETPSDTFIKPEVKESVSSEPQNKGNEYKSHKDYKKPKKDYPSSSNENDNKESKRSVVPPQELIEKPNTDRSVKKKKKGYNETEETDIESEEDARNKKAKDSKKKDSVKKEPEKVVKPGKTVLKKKKTKNIVFNNIDTEADSEGSPSVTRKKKKKKVVDQEAVKDSVKNTLKQMGQDQAKSFKRKKRKKTQDGAEVEVEVNVITVTEFISTQELANKLGVTAAEIIGKCFSLGLLITINQRLDKEQIELICSEFEFDCEFESEYDVEAIELEAEEEREEDLAFRPPIVTIMGHVDHGKTSLLDYIRKAHVVEGESGGITQHIGAYEAVYDEKQITFLDTPGHEAFTAMRARGAKVTDIVVIVIAADDSIMPQTIEAIDHSKAAGVPIIIAINKMDKPQADAVRIKADLSGLNVVVEDLGGKVQCVEISAKSGMGVESLLDSILIEAEMLDLKANPIVPARCVVVESRLDKGLGSIATVLVQKGTLKVGDIFVCGQYSGRVRGLMNERKERIKDAGPAIPAVVLGMAGTPKAGDILMVVGSEREAKEIATKRQQLNRAQAQHKMKIMSLDQISQQIKLGEVKELNIIIKGDVDGSVEAISDSIMKLSNDEVAVRVVHKGVGSISESDVLLAQASNAIILGFSVRPNLKAKELSERENVEIRLYSIIYDLINEVKQALEGLLSPDIKEEIVGTVEVRETFKVPKVGMIAGSYVLSGKIGKHSKVRLVRNDVVIYTGRISSLRRIKDDVKEVLTGFECGIGIENYNDLKIGDIIEVFIEKEVMRTLD
ncbi:MAG: translation initiation factor IF-2 [Candidatus Delongbacteria bacterium]|nr:translation initiation factor IF-2 [Candidatus Delongbacteria bacterium]MBN2835670.1 translation initiation factor IF-2 [Candidatus Delongbacteria bacterium]